MDELGHLPEVQERSQVNQTRQNRVRFPGIIRDAKRLNVSRIHLYLVLTGQRTSHRLLRRYQALNKPAA